MTKRLFLIKSIFGVIFLVTLTTILSKLYSDILEKEQLGYFKGRHVQVKEFNFEINDSNLTSLSDLPDDFPNQYQFHILHVKLKDSVDNSLVQNVYINRQIQNINQWLFSQTNGSSFRFDTYQGDIEITEVVLPISEEDFLGYAKQKYGEKDLNFNGLIYLNNALEDWLRILDRKSSFLNAGKIYIAYFEISKTYVCGHAPIQGNRVVGIYPIAINLRDNSPCTAFLHGNTLHESGVWEHLITHEMLHSLGFPSLCSKNIIIDSYHLNDLEFPNDIMGSEPGLYDPNPVLDPNHDDYYQTNLDCPDLSNSPFLEPLPNSIEIPENVLSNPYWRLNK